MVPNVTAILQRFTMEANTNHFAWTTEETIVQLNGVGPWGITYVNPADDPRKK